MAVLGYDENPYGQQQGRLKWGNNLPTAGGAAAAKSYIWYNHYWYGWRVYNVMSLVASVYSGQMQRCNRVMSEQFAPTFFDPTLYAAGTGLGVGNYPILMIDSYACAPYITADGSKIAKAEYIWKYCYGSPTQRTEALDWLHDLMQNADGATNGGQNVYGMTVSSTWTPGKVSYFDLFKNIRDHDHSTYGATYNLIQYEGGLGITPTWYSIYGTTPGDGINTYNGKTLTTNDVLNFFNGFYQSSQGADITAQAINGWTAIGGLKASLYPLVGAWGANSHFGAIVPNEFGTLWPVYHTWRAYNSTGVAT